jgi:hypothetical protein
MLAHRSQNTLLLAASWLEEYTTSCWRWHFNSWSTPSAKGFGRLFGKGAYHQDEGFDQGYVEYEQGYDQEYDGEYDQEYDDDEYEYQEEYQEEYTLQQTVENLKDE